MTSLLVLGLFFAAFGMSSAQSSSQQPSVVCIPGQCLQGFPNITLGTKLSASNAPTSLQLLPGQYTGSTNPQLLHNMLTSSSATLEPSPGFENATKGQTSLPLSLTLEPGMAIYSDKLYSGQAAFTQLPTSSSNSSTSISAKSLYLASNVWVALSSSSQSPQRTIVWESIPDIVQVPTLSSSLTLLDMQSTLCSPACSPNGGICSSTGSCSCKPNFTGASCESCAAGFFGPNCSPCPSGCSQCDEGINGSGRCLTRTVSSDEPQNCNCVNGKCGSNGQCQCNAGWTQGDDGKQCSKCADGLFQTSTGDCKVCGLNCLTCSSTTGQCLTCRQGFTLSTTDQTHCNPLPQSTSTGSICGEGSFAPPGSSTCQLCDSSCKTCTGPGSGDCAECAQGSLMFRTGNGQGTCVKADNQGQCQGTGGLVADNLKKECDTCGAKCTACQYSSTFTAASTIDQVQCTSCIPGSFLSQGKCVDNCPEGTFIGQDGFTCTKCDSSCSTCSGSPTVCTACSNGQLAINNGSCVKTCPDGTFASAGTNSSSTTPTMCQACHPDCASCSGPGLGQCTKCPSSAPILSTSSNSNTNANTGRCLAACPSKGQYFDNASSSCKSCDGSCSSCSGPGKTECLACSDPGQVLKGGSCVAASCTANAQPVPGLGVCLSDLAAVPTPSGTTPLPLPSITGLADPTKETGAKLEWWQILLMTLGCVLIFLVIVWLWRRRALKKRKERTRKWWGGKVAQQKREKRSWKERMLAVFRAQKSRKQGEVLPLHQDIGPKENYRDYDSDSDERTEKREKSLRSMHTDADLMEFIDAYDDRRTTRYTDDSRSVIAPSVLPSLKSGKKSNKSRILKERLARENAERNQSRLSVGHSLYSEYTGQAQRMPEPRQPINRSLFRQHTLSSMNTSSDANRLSNSLSVRSGKPFLIKIATGASLPRQTEAERYAASVRPTLATGAAGGSGGVREGALVDVGLRVEEVRKHPTGASGIATESSRNPFRIV